MFFFLGKLVTGTKFICGQLMRGSLSRTMDANSAEVVWRELYSAGLGLAWISESGVS